MEHNGIKRKIDLSRKSAAPPEVKGAGRSWKLALARAARDAVDLELAVTELRQNRRSLTELLELLPERALIIMLEGPKDGLGLLVLSPEVLSGILEMQMVGKVSSAAALTRRPTRTDAAMVAEMIDRALDGLETELLQSADLIWTSGFRYASFLEDARPLGLLLEDVPYRVLQTDVSLSDGAKTGQILLALPADGKGRQPKLLEPPPNRAAEMVFGVALGQQVQEANVELVAVLARVKVPLDLTLHLKPGDQLPIGAAALDHIDIEGLDGVRLAGGKLGQNRGMRAVRLAEEAKPSVQITQATILEATPTIEPDAVKKAG
ncbi:flagellar motor switch protein FliM (plasmid) [Pseudorhodobacter turbinis]|uniref:Flagellar motor switch protein FliM n=1 Tax=Pseudorhodobacter turbinis TaxID=2500533 RepID=A0A4P8EJY6_9RHOB|nr:FliM/FliN family flagellar motor C-terminal domain-containing protein [Pseudorhodobacter turbinis]QCO57308.1 flagellar motor switch protein FliM [Pseudorhodobacter turbinis]